MASQRQQVFQDYIAKIRYSNQLPPPPLPPKLLGIPGTGLGPKYTSAGFASRLAREQPLNIEADAELGMHIDLIGIPGVFDGDERAILADPHAGMIDPEDKALLRPLASLTKSVGITDTASFLRRTEYTASAATQMFTSSTAKSGLRKQEARRRPSAIDKEDPKHILRSVIKGFDIAYPQDADKSREGGRQGVEITTEEIKAWSHPRHPTKQGIQLLDSYPVLPDLDALPDGGAYTVIKYNTNPVSRTDAYENRLDMAYLQPVAPKAVLDDWERRQEQWDEASGEPRPLINWEYDFFMPETENIIGIKRKFDSRDEDCEDDSLYTDENESGQRFFKYSRVRRYETAAQHGDGVNLWNDSVAIALHNPETDLKHSNGSRLSKGAYLYPVSQRSQIRPKRKVGAYAVREEGDVIDDLEMTAVPLETEPKALATILEHKALYDPTVEVPAAPAEVEAEGELEAA